MGQGRLAPGRDGAHRGLSFRSAPGHLTRPAAPTPMPGGRWDVTYRQASPDDSPSVVTCVWLLCAGHEAGRGLRPGTVRAICLAASWPPATRDTPSPRTLTSRWRSRRSEGKWQDSHPKPPAHHAGFSSPNSLRPNAPQSSAAVGLDPERPVPGAWRAMPAHLRLLLATIVDATADLVSSFQTADRLHFAARRAEDQLGADGPHPRSAPGFRSSWTPSAATSTRPPSSTLKKPSTHQAGNAVTLSPFMGLTPSGLPEGSPTGVILLCHFQSRRRVTFKTSDSRPAGQPTCSSTWPSWQGPWNTTWLGLVAGRARPS